MSLYYILGRLARPGMIVFSYVHGRIARGQRSRVIVMNELKEILLVRNWGRIHWSMPGGGIERGESAKEAARRELMEETGIDAPLEAFAYVTTLTQRNFDAPIYMVYVEKRRLPEEQYNKREITHIDWHPLHDLPKVATSVAKALQKLAAKGQV